MGKVSGKGKKSMLCIDCRWLKRSPYCIELPREWFKWGEIVEEDREDTCLEQRHNVKNRWKWKKRFDDVLNERYIVCGIYYVQIDDSWKSDRFSLGATYGRERQEEDETIRSEGVKARKEERKERIRSNGGTRISKLWTKGRSA